MMWYPLLAFIVAFVILIMLLKTRLATFALDHPNYRSLHTRITPRTGGLGIMAGLVVALLVMGQTWLWLLPLLLLLTISLVDDVMGLPVRWRLLIQLTVSTGFVVFVLPDSAWWLWLLLVLGLVWMANLYNFMDGSDGLAGGMAIFGFGTYAVAAWFAHELHLAALNASVASASIAFLLFNFHPARIFLGDAGSVPLGFLAGAMGVYGWQQNLWPFWFPLLAFSPFIVDASVTLFKRLLKGEKIWQAHREHYYQRLVQMGWGHRKTALAAYLLMLAAGASSLRLLDLNDGMVAAMLVGWLLIYAWLFRSIDNRWHRMRERR